jgi:DNA-binding IscR family transcriptional regulator
MTYLPPTVKEKLLAHVKANPRQPTKVRIIGETLGSSIPSMRRALAELVREGRVRIVESRRGQSGGVVLEAV